MELQTISQVSKEYDISTRMLRYYEQIGLIQSKRKEGYTYRVYDEKTVTRLRQVILLRKLRVPVKQIVRILGNFDAAETVEIFSQNIDQLNVEIASLSTIKDILARFVDELNRKARVNLNLDLFEDETVISIINSLSFSNNQINEVKESLSMDNLNKANENLNKLEDKDVRIIYLPPMTVAAAYVSGEECEGKTINMIKQFVKDTQLLKIKPDARSFGFDCSNGGANIGEASQTYESWVSIPSDMEVPAPMVKRRFEGGLYAAHVLRSWDFDDWRKLGEWVYGSEKYESDLCGRWESPETVSGQGFEETMNFYNYIQMDEMKDLQLDLLYPIKEKVKQ